MFLPLVSPKFHRNGSRALGVLGLLAALLACQRQEGAGQQLLRRECRLAGFDGPARCGQIEVLEKRSQPAGRKLALQVAVVPASGEHPQADPVFLLAGGPGQGASEACGSWVAALSGLDSSRDFVLVDQRGTGRSGALECPSDKNDTAALFKDDQVSSTARACVSQLQADLAEYTTENAAADLDDVRRALGYERINLIGGSYGTRLALVYLRRYPGNVRSVVLDGAVPTDMAIPLSFARDTDASLELLLNECEQDASCKQAFGALREQLKSLVTQLTARPQHVSVAHPRSGAPVSLEIDRDTFAGLLRGLLYVPELSALLPLALSRAAHGDFSQLVSQAIVLAESAEESLSFGLFLSVICSEDIPRLNDTLIEHETRGTLLGALPAQELRRACSVWPQQRPPEDFFAPVVADTPTLILSGVLDPATPPRWGESVARHLAQSRHVVVPGASHGTLLRGNVPQLVAHFIQTTKVNDLDSAEVAKGRRIAFFIDNLGPQH